MGNDIWMSTYDAVFFISIGSMVVGLFGLIIRYCLKSKCEHFSLCFGILTIDRRVDLEVQEEMHRIDLGVADVENDTIPIQEAKHETKQSVKTKRPTLDTSNNEGFNGINMV